MKKFSFLIVDNNPIASQEVSDMLNYLGYKDVHITESSSDAWVMMQISDFDCIIAEWELPEMSGLALLKIARNDDKFFNAPFFLLNSAFTKIKIVQAGQSGVTGLIVKPVSLETLKVKVEMLGELMDDPDITEASASLEKGLELIEKKDFKKALHIFDDLVLKGESAEYYYNIGYIKTVQEKYGEAVVAFRKATQIDHLYAKAFKGMGFAYKQMGMTEDAEKHLQKAADIYMSKENVEDAEEILNEILKIGADSINVYNSLGVLYRKKGDIKKALLNYEKALKVHPNEPNIYYNIGRLYIERKEPESAKFYFLKAIEIDPEFKEASEVLHAIELGTI